MLYSKRARLCLFIVRSIHELLFIFPQGMYDLRLLGRTRPYLHWTDVLLGSGCPGFGNNNPAQAAKSIPASFRGTQSSPACDRGLLMRGRDHIHCMSDRWKGRLTLAYTCSLVPQLRPPTVSSNIGCKSADALPPPPGRLWQDLE